MSKINFEGFGISIFINDIAFNIFGIDIYWYAIFIMFAIVLGCFLSKIDDGKYGIKYEHILELMIFLIPISIICARIYYLLFKISYYYNNPLEIFNIRNGGLAIYGGIIGAILTIMIYCKIRKIKVLDICDYLIPYLALGQSIGRWGNFFNKEAYGTETGSIFRMGIYENGKYMQVHPTFLYESICTFIIFLLLFYLKNKRKYSGQLTYIYFLLYGITRAIIEGIRADSLMVGNIRISQIISIIIAIISIILLFRKSKVERKIE